jgi:ATP-dependent RNA helicase DDX24/MAK5
MHFRQKRKMLMVRTLKLSSGNYDLTVVEVDLPGWDSLNLSLPTLRALAKLSFTSPTPIQSSAIPEVLGGHDVIGKASTGSGKTLAFGIPILESFLNTNQIPAEEKQKLPMALILSPTRELAKQIHDHITALAAFVPDCNIVALTGGLSLQKQLRQLEERGGIDVIIATPGRLWEVVSEGRGWIEKLKQGLQFLVVDEADRLLQEGHFKEVEELLNLLAREEEPEFKEESDDEVVLDDMESKKGKKPKPKRKASNSRRQTLVFSATFHQGLQQKLASKGGKKGWAKTRADDLMDEKASMEYLLKKLSFREQVPKFIDVNPVGQLAERLREGIVECGAMEKVPNPAPSHHHLLMASTGYLPLLPPPPLPLSYSNIY